MALHAWSGQWRLFFKTVGFSEGARKVRHLVGMSQLIQTLPRASGPGVPWAQGLLLRLGNLGQARVAMARHLTPPQQKLNTEWIDKGLTSIRHPPCPKNVQQRSAEP